MQGVFFNTEKIIREYTQRDKTTKMLKEDFKPLTAEEEKTGKLIANAAYTNYI